MNKNCVGLYELELIVFYAMNKDTIIDISSARETINALRNPETIDQQNKKHQRKRLGIVLNLPFHRSRY